MNVKIIIRNMILEDAEKISIEFKKQGWDKSIEQYKSYYEEIIKNQREVLIAEKENKIVGYITIIWNSKYSYFSENDIPEISDLNVLIAHRNNGIGWKLMDEAEKVIQKKSKICGLGIGLLSDYGTAYKMYIKRGYIPDGKGVYKNGRYINYGENIEIDDDLNLYLTKALE